MSVLINITHDGFPLESLPPQGHITLHYSDGQTESFIGFRKDYDEWVKLLKDMKEVYNRYWVLLNKYNLN